MKPFLLGATGCLFMPAEGAKYTYMECVWGVTLLGKERSDATHELLTKGVEGYVMEKTEYRSISHLTDVGGKLAFIAGGRDGTSSVVFDGSVISTGYARVDESAGILPIQGSPAYLAFVSKSPTKVKRVVVWRGKSYGSEYSDVSNLSDTGDGPAFLAYKEMSNSGRGGSVIVRGDHEYGGELFRVYLYTISGNHIAYTGIEKEGANTVAVFDGKRYGPFKYVSKPRIEGDHIWSMVTEMDDKVYYLFDGKKFETRVSSSAEGAVLVGSALAFLNKEGSLVHGTFSVPAQELAGPRIGSLDGAVVYAKKTTSSKIQLMVGTKKLGNEIEGAIEDMKTLDGKVVVLVRSSDGMQSGIVYQDGVRQSDVSGRFLSISADGRIVESLSEKYRSTEASVHISGPTLVGDRKYATMYVSSERVVYLLQGR